MKLKNFSIKCNKCGSEDVVFDVEVIKEQAVLQCNNCKVKSIVNEFGDTIEEGYDTVLYENIE